MQVLGVKEALSQLNKIDPKYRRQVTKEFKNIVDPVVSQAKNANMEKMALSGLGGDEVFAGYDVFKRLSQIQKLRGMGLLQLWEMLPMSLRSLPFLKGKMREILALERVDVASGYELFRQLFSKGELAKYGLNVNFYASWSFELEKNHLFAWIGNEEVERYMKPVLLRDTDQMSMAHSLEQSFEYIKNDEKK
jgi:asparagine synthase (glutamine-hydrolysing)